MILNTKAGATIAISPKRANFGWDLTIQATNGSKIDLDLTNDEMRTIIVELMGKTVDPVKVYSDALVMARRVNQTVGENNDYYITVEQLEVLLNGN